MKNSGLWENQSLNLGSRMRPLRAVLAGFVASALVVGSMGVPAAQAKEVKRKLTAAQKSELRKRGREWCEKNHIRGGAFVVRVEVRNDGKVVCYMKE
jgi:hypothetical protein